MNLNVDALQIIERDEEVSFLKDCLDVERHARSKLIEEVTQCKVSYFDVNRVSTGSNQLQILFNAPAFPHTYDVSSVRIAISPSLNSLSDTISRATAPECETNLGIDIKQFVLAQVLGK